MTIAKLLVAPTIFFAALCLFLLDPESRVQALMNVGLHLNPPTITALSIIGMVFGLVMTLKTLAERHFTGGSQTK